MHAADRIDHDVYLDPCTGERPVWWKELLLLGTLPMLTILGFAVDRYIRSWYR
jgi:hypothetical protein